MKTFHFLGISIGFLGLMTTIGVFIGFLVAKKEAKRKGLNENVLYDLALYTVLSGMIGARLFFIIFYNLSYYLQNPVDIIKINDGGMSIHGGLFMAFVVGFIYIKINKLNFFKYADAIAPSIILGQGIGRVGCDVFGKPMNSPYFWGIQYQGQIVHPVQMYEFILNYLVFFLLWRIRKNTKYDGQLFFLYIILFSLNRGIVEFFRTNPIIFGWFSISHLLSVSFIISALIIMAFVKRNTVTFNLRINSIKKFEKKELFIDSSILLMLIIVSTFIYYFVQS